MRFFLPKDLADRQLKYLQLGGYCIALSGLYLFKKGSHFSLRNFGMYFLIIASLFLSIYTMPFITPATVSDIAHYIPFTHNLTSTHPEILYESSWSEVDSTSLTGFLQSRGVGNDKTLFITIANKKYVDAMVNFKFALDKWDLGQQYVVLCLDQKCMEAAESHNILAFNSNLMTDDNDEWQAPVARIKVIPISNALTLVVRGESRPCGWWVQFCTP